MALPDISHLTIPELQELAERAQRAQVERQQQSAAGLANARAALDRLIGPDQPTAPSMNALTEVQLYTDQQIGAHAVLGLRLAFRAVEQVARTVRDLVVVIGR